MLHGPSMRAAAHGVIRFLPIDGHAPTQPRSATDWLLTSFLVLVLAALLAATVAGLSSERRALRSLPRAQRLAARFDECRGECAALVHRQLTPPPVR
jgi:hypothetical protein